MPYNANSEEQKILKYWEEHKCFEKSVEQRPDDKPYVFYDGPPFATGLPHYGHIVASLIKDVVPRYWTMNGFKVERKWGWDCHGLPIENIIEKKLNLNSKSDIEEMGVEKFCDECRQTVLTYAEEWKTTIKRMGRWVDMENSYRTMDKEYMESVWWVFKQLWEKKYIYQGYKAMHICPRCVTPLSNFEVTQGYKDVKDLSVTAEFKLTNAKEKFGLNTDIFMLAWTTTPWTLPGNVLLAVGEDIDYVICESEEVDNLYITAKDRLEDVFGEGNYNIKKELKGKDLVELTYEPLFPYFQDAENGFKVVAGNFVTTENGTGVVHIAPAFGDDDYELGKQQKTGWIQHVNMEGKFIEEVTDFAGLEVKPKEDPTSTDLLILKWLNVNGKLFSKKKFEHSYPHCWRCDTPLLNYATSSWFVKVTELKADLIKNNKKINWIPEHIKEGRFGLWLEGARDWAISRTRYWGTPLPVWQSEDGDNICVGSVNELEELTGQKVEDLHKPVVDKLVIEKDGKKYKRITEVLDCWFESGSMPYGQMHYPFENKEKFEAGFPAEFIAEGQDQTRGWFYTLHVLASALTKDKNSVISRQESEPAFKNVIVNGIVLAEDGKKMSKRLNNYPDPNTLLDKYGADAMRYYLVSSPVMHAESLNFSEDGVKDIYNKVVNMISNILEFYLMYANESENSDQISDNILDKWILSKLQKLTKEVGEKMNAYKLSEASRPILMFITELSQWYVRRSRNRFKIGDEDDKKKAVATLKQVLKTLSKLMAPFTPFMAEKIYLEVDNTLESVHLETWPEVDSKLENNEVLEKMDIARKVVELGLSLRVDNGIKVKQPLGKLIVAGVKLDNQFLEIIADELNVKKVVIGDIKESDGLKVKKDSNIAVGLDIELTEELKKEGMVREIIRAVNQIRKEKKLNIDKKAVVIYKTDNVKLKQIFTEYSEQLKMNTASVDFKEGLASELINLKDIELFLSVEVIE